MSARPFLIGIAGATCSGKTTLARGLAEQLAANTSPAARVTLVSLDWYYRDLSHLEMAERIEWNFDSPEALDHELLTRQLSQLAHGQAVDAPQYDFARHTRRKETVHIAPGRFLIIEGLFALYWQALRDLMHLKVFVDADDTVCLARRLTRDVRERGRTPQSVRAQYTQSVRPMYQRYIGPTREFADVQVSGQASLDHIACHLASHLRSVVPHSH